MKGTGAHPNRGLIILSFAIIYIVWGSTYLFAAFAMEQIAAFTLCGFRYLIASVITAVIAVIFFKPTLPTRYQVKNALIAGFVFMGLGTGGALWALNYLDTGLTALIISGEPLIIVMMMWLVDKKRPANQAFIGIGMGILGMYLLVSQKALVGSPEQWKGVLVILFSMLAWGAGSIFVSKVELPESQWVNSAIQMFMGGLTTFIISVTIGETNASVEDLTSKTLFSMAYLIVLGSVAAFTAFNYLLKTVSTEKVATNTYVNPIIAMFLGYQFHDEPLTSISIVAAVVMLSGVFIINSNKS